MSEDRTDQKLPSHPDFGLDPSEKINKLKSFFRTKNAILNGEPLFDFNQTQLKKNSYMGPWLFNLTESVFAAIPALIFIKIFSFLFPVVPDETSDDLIKLINEIMSWITPFLIPLSLFFIAWGAGYASLLKIDRSTINRRRATFAYLYYDGGYGLIAQALLVLGLSIQPVLAQENIPENIHEILLIMALPLSLIGGIWTIIIMGKKIPNMLWKLNGYSNEKRSFFKKKNNDITYAPHTKYALTVGIGTPLLYVISVLILSIIVSFIAYQLLQLKLFIAT